MAKFPGGVVVSGYISPSDTADQYATHRASLGMGGYRSVTDLSTRDSITSLRREEGMIVYVISESKEYRLIGGIANENWVEIVSTGGSGDTNYIIVNNINERDLLNLSYRKIGLICYTIDTDKEYRLVNGIDNTNWNEISVSEGGCCNYVIVNSLTDIENYPMDKRFVGLTLYSSDSDKEFRFVGGIENTNLKEINSTIVNYKPDGTIVITQPTDNGETNTTIDNTITNVEVINNYFNTIGCLNKAKISEILLLAGSGFNPIYTDSNGNEIISSSNLNEFSFKINKSEYWVEDWVYFSGTTKIEPGKVSEVFMEIYENGIPTIYNITEMLNGNITPPTDFAIFGTQSKWKGYFKGITTGRKDIKVYQTIDTTKMATSNKTVYFFAPNFAIKDGISPTPLNIIVTSIISTKEYTVNVLPNTNLFINLAKVQVTSFGIDNTNYTIIPGTAQAITTDGTYLLSSEILQKLIDGQYSLVVTGSDAGVAIPAYFYGPFSVKINYGNGS